MVAILSKIDLGFETESPIDRDIGSIKLPLRGFVSEEGDYYIFNELWVIKVNSDGENICIEAEGRGIFGVSSVSFKDARNMMMDEIQNGGYEDEFRVEEGAALGGISFNI